MKRKTIGFISILSGLLLGPLNAAFLVFALHLDFLAGSFVTNLYMFLNLVVSMAMGAWLIKWGIRQWGGDRPIMLSDEYESLEFDIGSEQALFEVAKLNDHVA